jgi:hypothetical protein
MFRLVTEPSLFESRARPLARALAVGLFAVLLAALGYTILQQAYALALCCGDDAAMAVVAKNLVWGAGYSVSIESNGQPGIIPFSPDISTGPAVILPAALGILIFGNRTWVPGVSEALTVIALLAGIAWAIGRRTSAVRGAAFGALFLVGALGATVLHFEHWHTLLGELPAALYAVLGIAVLSLGPPVRRTALAGGLLLGLAIASKLLVVFAVAGYGAIALARAGRRAYRDRAARGARLRADAALLGWTAAGAVIPPGAFELFKLISLGPGGYAANTAQELAFAAYRNDPGQSPGRLAVYAANAAGHYPAFGAHFGFSLLALALLCAFALFVVLTRARAPGARAFACALAAGSALSLAWWLFASIGWPRYAVIGLVLAAALLACAAFARPASGALIAVLVLAVVVRPHAEKIADNLRFSFGQGFAETDRVRRLHETTAFLAAHPGAPLLSGWWATDVELEYTLPTVANFTRWDHVPPATVEGDWLVRDEPWVRFLPLPGFAAFEARCRGEVWTDEPFRITSCGAGGLPPARSKTERR